MRWLAAGVTFVNFATVSGLIFGILGQGLSPFTASAAFTVGIFAAVLAYLRTLDSRTRPEVRDSESALARYRDAWKWLVAACFVIFAVRSFCWLLYIDADQLRIQSPNNLGDLALHITYVKNFANGVALWPDNPIFDGSKLRYPAGIDLFNALLCLQHFDLIRGLVWVGLLGALATFYSFYRWAGSFGVAGFLFNGGLVGFKFLTTYKFIDYQGANDVAWKSVPLSMFVTQRGLLYAIPAGLLLLCHWREKFFVTDVVAGGADPGKSNAGSTNRLQRSRLKPLPFWVELSIYSSMPLFHVHTFLALSGVLVSLAIFGDASMRKHIALLIALAFLPATFFVWLISDNFQAGSVFAWHPGWVQHEGEFAAPFFVFWFKNFGIFIPLLLAVLGFCGWRIIRSNTANGFRLLGGIALGVIVLSAFRIWQIGFGWIPVISILFSFGLLLLAAYGITKAESDRKEKPTEEMVFLFAAIAIFAFAYFVKTAPWGWDNLKIMIWAYFLVLPFLWKELIIGWPIAVRAAVLFALFGSGCVSLLGGLAAGREGFGFADRAELDGVGDAVATLPVKARFAAYPTYNHPLLLQGRKVVLGYPGHLWTEGFDYNDTFQELTQLMNGAADWKETAQDLQVRYIFWGREETANYSSSTRPWEKAAARIASGNWGAIYEVPSTTNQHE
jgi:hypothetical protein